MTRLVLAVAATLTAATGVDAQLPETKFGNVFPPCGGRGTTFELRVAGVQDLDYTTAPRLVFSHPGITAEAVINPTDNQWHDTFRVSIAGDVPLGHYDLRLNGIYGTSAPRAFRVDASPSESEAADIRPDAPATLVANVPFYGRIGAVADVDAFVFSAEQGTTVVVLCDASALDSPLQPVIEVTDPSGRRMAQAGEVYGGTVVLPMEIGATGQHAVRLTDAAYRGNETFQYRIEIATLPVVTTIWPPFGQPGTSQPVEVLGYNLPDGIPVAEGEPLLSRSFQVELPADSNARPAAWYRADADGFRFPLESMGIDAAAPPMFFSPTPPIVETVGHVETPEFVSLPVEIAGRLEKTFDVDRYLVDLKAGETLIAEVFAKRYGSTADAVLVVDRIDAANGDVLERIAAIDDRATKLPSGFVDASADDPLFRFEAKADGRYQISVHDRYSSARGGSGLFYRLSLRRPTPDFRLHVVPHSRDEEKKLIHPDSINLRRRQSVLLPVVLDRLDGFDSPVEIDVEGLPPGVSTDGAILAEGQNSANLILTADADAIAGWKAVTVVGRAILPGGDEPIRRIAKTGTVVRGGPNFTGESRNAHELIVSVADDAVPFRIEGSGQHVQVAQGGQLLIPLSAVRHEGFDAAITVTADPLPADSKVGVETGALTADDNQLLARLIVDPAAPPRTVSTQFQGRAPMTTSPFPHRLARSTEHQKRAAGKVADARTAVDNLIVRRDEAAAALATTEEALRTADDAVRPAAAAAVDASRAAFAEREAAVTAEQAVLQQREAELKSADAALEVARKAAEPRSVELSSPAPAITLSIVPAPVAVTVTPDNGGTVLRNESIAVKVVAERRDGFAGEIRLALALPDGVTGLTAEPVTIGPDATEAVLRISAAGDAAEGSVPFPAIRAVAGKDGNVPIDVPVTLTVAP